MRSENRTGSRTSLSPTSWARSLQVSKSATARPWAFRNSLLDEFPFIHPDDLALYRDWETKSFEVQVANHELLGHGSGKLFKEEADGTKNFDPEKVWPLNQPVFSQCNLSKGNQPSYRQTGVSFTVTV